MGRKIKDITGLKFNRWTVLEYIGQKYNNNISIWRCKCDCGTIKEVRGDHLKNGRSKSCGCFMKEFNTKNNMKHGHGSKKIGRTPTYRSWEAMKLRCLNENHKAFKNYGRKGITICKFWMKFENFLEDMGERPEGYELHRKNNSKGYSPNNCEWKDRIKHREDH